MKTELSLSVLIVLACFGLIGGQGAAAMSPEQAQPGHDDCCVALVGGLDGATSSLQGCCPAAFGGSPSLPDQVRKSGPENAYGLLYHLVENTVLTQKMAGIECHMFNFLQFLDAGYVGPENSTHVVLDLKDYPTSKVTSTRYDRYFYISTPNNPLIETFGFQMFDWDVAGQTLWMADFMGGDPAAVAPPEEDRFPGDVAVAPGNRYLLYPLTAKASPTQAIGAIMGKFDPFISDSSLVITDLTSGDQRTVLANRYNRRLFASFADFSADGNSFYTLAREENGFTFVKIALDSGTVTDFKTLFPDFDWGSLQWNDFFPKANDVSYAYFSISPDETRLIAYKDVLSASTDNPCRVEAAHHLWLFDFERNILEVYRSQPARVADAAWRADSSTFALALVTHGGCYPEDMDSSIELFDRNARALDTLVNEPKSKITTIGWSPDSRFIAYDVYSTDFVGRLRTVDVSAKSVQEVVNTQDLGYAVNQTKPVTLLFADWVVR